MCPRHPEIERVVEKNIRQNWANHSPYTKGNFEFERVVRGWRSSPQYLTCALRGNTFMTDDSIDQSGQGSAAERRLRHAAAAQYSVARGDAALIARVRPVRTSSVSVSGRSATARPAGRSLRGYGTDHAQASGENSTSLAGVCEKQWADYRSDRDPRVGCVSEYSEKAWLSRAKRAARFKFGLTMCLIACTIQSSPRPTVFWCPFGSALSAAV